MEQIMKSILIFGAGVSGLGVLNFCQKKGINCLVYDDNPAKTGIKLEDINFTQFEGLVLSPGIKLSHPLVLKARESGLRVISDLEVFKMFAPSSLKIIGITGSNGKSTTSSLVYHILKEAGKKAFLGGNIGISPLAEQAFNSEFCVLEVSSYQLEITDFIFDASVILNITPDHLEHHAGMEGYIKAKARILRGKGFRLVSADCPNLEAFQNGATLFSVHKKLEQGFYIKQNKLFKNGVEIHALPAFPNLKGEHNLENILAAIIICHEFCGLSIEEIITAISSFKPLPHRIELVAEKQGVTFINDSKATNASSTKTALKALGKRPVFLIAGGRAKEEGIEALIGQPEFSMVKEVVLIGEASGDFTKKIIAFNREFPEKQINYFIAGTLERAVKLAFTSAKKVKNATVLLSPLCASFDQFKNFEERGEVFKKLVKEL